MTVSTSIGRELTIGTIWLRAFNLAGLYDITQSLRAADKAIAKDFSEVIVDQLSLYGVAVRQKTFDTVSLTAGTYRYNLAATTLDIVGDGQYIAAGTADLTKAAGETIVKQEDLETWQRISAKNATGRPSLFFANRVANTVAAWLWPIPDEAGYVRFVVQRHLADMNDENATMDLEAYWTEYVIWALAAALAEASSIPGAKVERLRAGSLQRLQKAKSFANPHVENFMYYDHRVH